MTAKPMDDLRRSVRRVVTRLAVLAMLIVAGAITIAQAQRGSKPSSEPAPPQSQTTSTADAQPPGELVPLKDTEPVGDALSPPGGQESFSQAGSGYHDSNVLPASGQLPDDSELEFAASRTSSFRIRDEASRTGYDQTTNPSAQNLSAQGEEQQNVDEGASEASDLPPPFPAESSAAPLETGLPEPTNDQLPDSGVDYGASLAPLSAADQDTSSHSGNTLRSSSRGEPAKPAGSSSAAEPTTAHSASDPVTALNGVGEASGTDDPSSATEPATDASEDTPASAGGAWGAGHQPAQQNDAPVSVPDAATLSPDEVPTDSTYQPLGIGSGTDSAADGTAEEASTGEPGALSDSGATTAIEDNGDATGSRVPARGRPGATALEGSQTPSFTVQKIAPPEVQVGRAARFEIRVQNVGSVAAEQVLIRDEIPYGMRYVGAQPAANQTADGAIYWEVGTLRPSEKVSVFVELVPEMEGQLGSTATVSFSASATARTRSTRPQLVLEHVGPREVLVGETVRFTIKLSNPGSGAATQVTLEEDVPPGLKHNAGPRLEYSVGVIGPGQTRHLELLLKADRPGPVINRLVARADGGLMVESEAELEVVAPQLEVAVEGPARRYLDRQAVFSISVANPGTAPAKNVELVAQLPPTLRFVTTNNAGHYDQARHAVMWSLEQLPAGEMGKAQFTAVPTETGQFKIRAEGKAEMNLTDSVEHQLRVEGIAALGSSVADLIDPIEVAGETTYEIVVENQGSKAATNVRLTADVPDGLKPLGGEGPTRAAVQGQQVSFAPLAQLAPKSRVTYRLLVAGQRPGDYRVRVQIASDELSQPVQTEESTRVYSDQ